MMGRMVRKEGGIEDSNLSCLKYIELWFRSQHFLSMSCYGAQMIGFCRARTIFRSQVVTSLIIGYQCYLIQDEPKERFEKVEKKISRPIRQRGEGGKNFPEETFLVLNGKKMFLINCIPNYPFKLNELKYSFPSQYKFLNILHFKYRGGFCIWLGARQKGFNPPPYPYT